MDIYTLLITILTATLSGGAASAIAAGIMARRKTQAEAVSIERTVEQKAIELAESTYKQIIETLQRQVKEQASKIEVLEAETRTQEGKIALLEQQVDQLREVNKTLLDTNAELKRKAKDCEDCEKLFGKRN